MDNRGQLIGVTTAIASRTGQSAGVGFAIPVTAVRRIAPQLIRDGRVVRAAIGISKVAETEQGLLVVSTTPNGPAEKAGLKPCDYIWQINGKEVFELSHNQCVDAIKSAGTSLTLATERYVI